jgi:hypothetical protein
VRHSIVKMAGARFKIFMAKSAIAPEAFSYSMQEK